MKKTNRDQGYIRRRMAGRALAAAFFLVYFAAYGFSAAFAPGEKWFLITIADSPVGYLHDVASRKAGAAEPLVLHSSEMKMVLNRLGARVEMRFISTSEETEHGELKKVGYELQASVMSTKTEAVVEAGRILLRSESGGKSYTRTIEYTGTLLGEEGLRLLAERNLKKPGDAVSFQTFIPELEAVSQGRRKVLEQETLRLQGRDIRTVKVEEYIEANAVATVAWLDETGDIVKENMPTPFGTGVSVLTDRDRALAVAAGGELPPEMFERSVIRSNIRLPKARSVEYLKLKLIHKNPDLGWPDLALPFETVVSKEKSALVIEIRRPSTPNPSAFPVRMDEGNRPFLEPNAYIQSDDDSLRSLARSIIGSEKDAFRAALKLERWVADNMTFDLGIALAPSSEIFRNKRGTCLGYATLLAAMTRAVGIPSRVVLGYVYALAIFGGHAWTEVLADGSWIPVDAAIPTSGVADAARLGIVATSFGDGAGLLSGGAGLKLFGQIDIKILEYAGPDGKKNVVSEGAAPYRVTGDLYENPALGIALRKPPEARFTKLDAAWPDTALVRWEGPAGVRVELQEVYLKPWSAETDAAAAILSSLGISVKPGRANRPGFNGYLGASGGKAALVLFDRPEAWVLFAEGKEPAKLLEKAAAGLTLTPTAR
jgi:hypothetical protein